MPVMKVGVVRMGVHQPLVAMGVYVRLAPIPREVVLVPMMLVVNMLVDMLHRLVRVLMLVTLA